MAGCTHDNSSHLGRYIFMDDEYVCHVKPDCPNLQNGKDSKGGHPKYAMQPLDTATFILQTRQRVCSKCVSEATFTELQDISDRHTWIIGVEKNRKWLYEWLVSAGYEIGSYDDFVKQLTDPGRCRQLYQMGLDQSLRLGTYDDFLDDFGINPPRPKNKEICDTLPDWDD